MNTLYPRKKALLTHSLKAVGMLVIVAALAGFWLGAARVTAQADSPVWRDEFDGSLLAGWSWVNENSDMWNLGEQPGFLRIYTAPGPTGAQNLLLRPAPEGDFAIQTHLLFEPVSNYQIAGLVIYEGEGTFLQLGRAFCDVEGACVGNGIYFDYVEDWGTVDSNFGASLGQDEAYLRLERRGSEVWAYYSDDGIHWSQVGAHTLADDFSITGVGLTASQDAANVGTPADFDYFALGLPVYGFPRIVTSVNGDFIWTTDFAGDALLSFSIYDSSAPDAALLWQGSKTADAGGFALFDAWEHGIDLQPGNYIVVSDGISTKGVVLEPISMDVFDTEKEIMAGTAPQGREVRAAAGPQDWQVDIWVTANPGNGQWMAHFKKLDFDITEDMRPWSYAQIFDDDWDANEAGTPPPPAPPQARAWVAAYTYDLPPGAWSEGTHSYFFEWVGPDGAGESWASHEFVVSNDAPLYSRYVLLRVFRELARMPGDGAHECTEISSVHPEQPTRFLYGILLEDKTYGEARAYFDSLTATIHMDDGQSAQLIRQEIRPFDEPKWWPYVCTWTLRE